MEKQGRLKLRAAGREIEVEGSADLIAAVVRHLIDGGVPTTSSNLPPDTPEDKPSGRPAPASDTPGTPPRKTDIREFFVLKSPAKDVDAAAAVAYYYQFVAPPEERRDSVDASLLQEAFRHASYPIPARPSQTLVNAKAAGYLSLGPGKGQYRLTTVGHNQVAHRMGEAKPAATKRIERRKATSKGKK